MFWKKRETSAPVDTKITSETEAGKLCQKFSDLTDQITDLTKIREDIGKSLVEILLKPTGTLPHGSPSKPKAYDFVIFVSESRIALITISVDSYSTTLNSVKIVDKPKEEVNG